MAAQRLCASIACMSVHYESVHLGTLYPEAFGIPAPLEALERHIWPRKPAVFIRLAPAAEPVVPAPDLHADSGLPALPTGAAVKGVRQLQLGQFGLVPPWVKSASDAKLRSTKLVNARSETVTTTTSFRDSWLKGQRCIVPMMAFFEDDWRSGKAVPTRISRVDGKPMGVAGLWEHWAKDGQEIISFTLLTVNANSHALLHRYQQGGNEKRMPAILGEGTYDAWLNARHEKAKEFMRAYPANRLTANPVEGKRLSQLDRSIA
jgi:putative SOS response-associated peptidase YedK